MSRAEPPAGDLSQELNQVLDKELRQLPEKYRAPLVLCYLEGKTHQQVAEELRWPTGTMSRRLARGQELLRQRLLRRGLALSAVALGQVNDTSFILLGPGEIPAESEAAGLSAGGCSLSLVCDRSTWEPGDSPLPFSVVLNRLDENLRTLRFLQANQLGRYYHLEITGPRQIQRIGMQLAAGAGVAPRADRFARHQLMFLQLEHFPVGKSLGERLEWNPSGDFERPYHREPVIRPPHWGASGYSIRAVYQLRDKDQKLFGDEPAVVRLVSNPVEVQIRD
jgi:hypothetical protein